MKFAAALIPKTSLQGAVAALALFALGCAGDPPRSRDGSGGGGGEEDSSSIVSSASGQGGYSAVSSSSGGTAGGGGSGGISGGGTGFTSPEQMFDWVNQVRDQYKGHIPYDGYPFQGNNADVMTWSLVMTWDAGLAAEAQAEAEKLAAGAEPTGLYYPYQNEADGEGMWLSGLETAKYMVSAKSDGYLKGGTDPFGNPEAPHKWHDTGNGFYRMAVAYQTGTGTFNHKSLLGVGAAEGGDQVTWWVLLFSE